MSKLIIGIFNILPAVVIEEMWKNNGYVIDINDGKIVGVRRNG